MRKTSRSAISYLFTVKVWFEDLGDGRSEWRGEVKDVTSDYRHYFRDWGSMLAFFQASCQAFEPDMTEKKAD